MRRRAVPAAVTTLALAVAVVGGNAAGAAAANYQPLPNHQALEITSVSPKTFAAVGAGRYKKQNNEPPRLADDPTLSHHGRPEVAYVHAEWCPYCAAESWSVAVALSRFGTLHGLTTITTPGEYGQPRVKTVSFRYASFSSKYLYFAPIVYADPQHHRVDFVPRNVKPAWKRDTGGGGFPFIDFGGKAVLTTSSYDPTLLKQRSRSQIAGVLNSPKRRLTKAIDGSANQLTAAICLATKQKPGKVCHSKTIRRISRSLK